MYAQFKFMKIRKKLARMSCELSHANCKLSAVTTVYGEQLLTQFVTKCADRTFDHIRVLTSYSSPIVQTTTNLTQNIPYL